MKKTWKITALATAITIMSISVLGCGAKDNADTPASPAKESESGTEKTETEATESTESTDTADSADSAGRGGEGRARHFPQRRACPHEEGPRPASLARPPAQGAWIPPPPGNSRRRVPPSPSFQAPADSSDPSSRAAM